MTGGGAGRSLFAIHVITELIYKERLRTNIKEIHLQLIVF